MTSYVSSVGFPVTSRDEFDNLAVQAARVGDTIRAQAGDYRRWNVGGGVQLWVTLNDRKQIRGLAPHFSGRARMRVVVTERVQRPEYTPLEGAFRCWANPRDVNATDGDYPFIFHAPDYGLHSSLTLPAIRTVQVTAFASALTAYVDDEAFAAGQLGKFKMAPESFIPSGLFTAQGTPSATAHTIINGHVLRTTQLANAVTGKVFHWAWIRTYGGEYDIVADEETLTGTLIEGGVASGSFWLSGRLIEESDVPIR